MEGVIWIVFFRRRSIFTDLYGVPSPNLWTTRERTTSILKPPSCTEAMTVQSPPINKKLRHGPSRTLPLTVKRELGRSQSVGLKSQVICDPVSTTPRRTEVPQDWNQKGWRGVRKEVKTGRVTGETSLWNSPRSNESPTLNPTRYLGDPR